MGIQFEKVEFDASNTEPRCPCVLLLDTSYSMQGEPIKELNNGLSVLRDELNKDELAMLRVELSIITFGPVNVHQDFVTASDFNPEPLSCTGATPMGEAINLALDKIDERKQAIKEAGISYFRPWVFLITDGAPTDKWQGAAQRVREAEANKKVVFFPVGVEGADMDILDQISERTPLKLKGLAFAEMFTWLSSSLGSVSHSSPGEEVALESPMGWGTV